MTAARATRTSETNSTPILHLLTQEAWATAPAGALRPASLVEEGFVHCSAPEQVAGVANARFATEDELVMLVLDPETLEHDVVWEDSYGAGQSFPHVYGPIDREQIVRVLPYRTGADGSFEPPDPRDLRPPREDDR